MAVLAMQKIGILTLKKDADAILEVLQESGDFHPVSESDNNSDEAFHAVELRLANLKFVIDFLAPFAQEPGNFREKMLGDRVESSESKALLCAEKDFSDLVAETEQCEAERNRIATDRIKNREMSSLLENWKSLHFSLSDSEKSETARFFVGSLEKKDFSDFEAEVQENSLLELRVISSTEKQTFFVLVAHHSVLDVATELLSRFRFVVVDRTVFHDNVPKQISILEHESQDLDSADKKNEKHCRELAKKLSEVKLAYDGLLWQRDRRIAENGARMTDATVVFTGFAPKKAITKLRRKISHCSQTTDLFLMESHEETPPVLIKNSSLASPFQQVLNLFGTPAHNEVDPTPYLAPFFIIFFGFCLTDAGYGVLIALSAFWALRVLPLGRDMREMVHLVFFGGISTLILGILFGGYFGMTPEQLPFLVADPETGRFYGQLWNPIEDLVPTVMLLAYGLGAAHLILGVILKTANEWNRGNQGHAFWLGIPEILLLFSLGGMFFVPMLKWVALVAFLLMIWGLGAGMPLLARPIIGLVKFFMDIVVAWLSNILSYSRLFSLGLATGVIALAFNSIALTIGGMLPLVIGIPVGIFILLFGHTLNIGLNLLGAFVHSARLQFVEFFGKFFEGGGKLFTPLRRETKYLFDPKIS